MENRIVFEAIRRTRAFTDGMDLRFDTGDSAFWRGWAAATYEIEARIAAERAKIPGSTPAASGNDPERSDLMTKEQ